MVIATTMNGVKVLDRNEFLDCKEAVIVDVRTPAEYDLGHIPEAVNLPLFSDDERAIVGTLYKQVGREEAIERGLELVGPKLAQFVRQAKSIAQGRPLALYCWRGGMRSGSMAWLLSMAGLEVLLLRGGYKAYRQGFEELMKGDWRFVALGGHTGSGKTELLLRLRERGYQVLDLEGLANHKGSAFGGIGKGEQPTTEMFINRLHQAMREFAPTRPVLCETESVTIGKVFIPLYLFEYVVTASCIRLSMSVDQRIERLIGEYCNLDPEQLKESLARIRKRLGGNNMDDALQAIDRGDMATAVRIALFYYDKGYSKSSARHRGRLLATLEIDNNDLERALKQIETIVAEFEDGQ